MCVIGQIGRIDFSLVNNVCVIRSLSEKWIFRGWELCQNESRSFVVCDINHIRQKNTQNKTHTQIHCMYLFLHINANWRVLTQNVAIFDFTRRWSCGIFAIYWYPNCSTMCTIFGADRCNMRFFIHHLYRNRENKCHRMHSSNLYNIKEIRIFYRSLKYSNKS